MINIIKKNQIFHLEPPTGLLNDPNGLVHFNGVYYVFFQWNKFLKDHSYKEWGMFTSKNFYEWKFEGSAILPDQKYDIDGVYSGSAEIIDDRLILYYTGNTKPNGIRKTYQCYSESQDGKTFEKKGIFTETPNGYTEHFRDPKVLKVSESNYWMVIGAQTQNGEGAITLFHSENGKDWDYHSEILRLSEFQMIECPDLFIVDNKAILIYSPQKRDNLVDKSLYSFSVYKPGQFDVVTGEFQEEIEENYQLIDEGFDFYAPQSFYSDEGKRILIAWMSNMTSQQEKVFGNDEKHIHCMTLPRELTIVNGNLIQKVPKAIYSLLGKKVDIYEDSNSRTKIISASRGLYLNLATTKNNFKFSLNNEISLSYDSSTKEFSMTRNNWVNQKLEEKLLGLNELMNLEIWMDTSSIEVFINNGVKTLSSRFFTESEEVEIQIEGSKVIEAREISSIYSN